jgi:hypothetical protein
MLHSYIISHEHTLWNWVWNFHITLLLSLLPWDFNPDIPNIPLTFQIFPWHSKYSPDIPNIPLSIFDSQLWTVENTDSHYKSDVQLARSSVPLFCGHFRIWVLKSLELSMWIIPYSKQGKSIVNTTFVHAVTGLEGWQIYWTELHTCQRWSRYCWYEWMPLSPCLLAPVKISWTSNCK